MQWYCASYMDRLRLLQQRRNGKKPGRNIWTGVGYLRAFAGKVSFNDIRQERDTPLSLTDKRKGDVG